MSALSNMGAKIRCQKLDHLASSVCWSLSCWNMQKLNYPHRHVNVIAICAFLWLEL